MNKVYAIFLWFALLFCHNGLLAQNGGVIVTGKVYAEDEPEGFIVATVIEQDKIGRIYSSALTDFNGNFSLKIKNPNNSLNFSFVGYKKLTVPIGNKRKFDVKLESQNVMKEVTVKASKLVGGGGLAIPEREYSGAMQKFNTKAIEGVSVASIDDALQGRIDEYTAKKTDMMIAVIKRAICKGTGSGMYWQPSGSRARMSSGSYAPVASTAITWA